MGHNGLALRVHLWLFNFPCHVNRMLYRTRLLNIPFMSNQPEKSNKLFHMVGIGKIAGSSPVCSIQNGQLFRPFSSVPFVVSWRFCIFSLVPWDLLDNYCPYVSVLVLLLNIHLDTIILCFFLFWIISLVLKICSHCHLSALTLYSALAVEFIYWSHTDATSEEHHRFWSMFCQEWDEQLDYIVIPPWLEKKHGIMAQTFGSSSQLLSV